MEGCRVARLIGYDGGMENAAPSAPKIRFGRLRIAWSVLAAVTCICLIVFWVRSFRITDSWIDVRNGGSYHQFASARGEFIFDRGDHVPGQYHYWQYAPRRLPDDWRVPANIIGFRFGAPNS